LELVLVGVFFSAAGYTKFFSSMALAAGFCDKAVGQAVGLEKIFLFAYYDDFKIFRAHFKKMDSTEIVVSVRPSVCPSVSYFSAAFAPRELKFST
jgi:hypothetical protein